MKNKQVLSIVTQETKAHKQMKAQKLCRGRLFGHKRVIDDFCAAILEDRDPAVSAEEGLLPLRVICAAYESAKTGKTIFFD